MLDQDVNLAADAVDEPAAPARAASALGAAFALAACGGGGGDGGTTSAPATTTPPPVTVVQVPLTPAQASRFLGQATMGATRAEIDRVIARGFEGWITDQFATPRGTTHWDWLVANGYQAGGAGANSTGWDATIWRALIAEPDQLRQRVGQALLDMLVVSVDQIGVGWRQFAMAAYMDLIADHAFGNYRELLGAVTTNAAMASFLTFLGNRRANPQRGSVPDENYARELMQLFTIGVQQLEPDGRPRLNNGQPIETYTTADVSQLARVFTGLTLATTDAATPDRLRQPLIMSANLNETGASTFLGTTVSGGGLAAVNAALDAVFAHANVPPFVATNLIRRLTTSNPSPAYVGRVAAAFANNGQGARGDMRATIRAILLDPEVRGDAPLADARAGRLRDPVLRVTNWARASGATAAEGKWSVGNLADPISRLGQSPGRAPSVFNFFRPGYAPPASAIATAGLVAPELQITTEQSVVGYVNQMYGIIANGAGDVKSAYADLIARAPDPAALVDEINIVLAAGQLSPATTAAMRGAVESIPATANDANLNRVRVALLLCLAAPDYLLLR